MVWTNRRLAYLTAWSSIIQNVGQNAKSRGQTRARSWWGWGFEDQAIGRAERNAVAGFLAQKFKSASGTELPFEVREAPDLASVDLRASRVAPPDSLAAIFSNDKRDRLSHTYGKSFSDVVMGLHGEFDHPPDQVAFPSNDADIAAIFDWCSDNTVALIPYGGGSSVVGGVNSQVDGDYRGVISLDMSKMNNVTDIDKVSRCVQVQAGTFGPHLEDQLRSSGYTMRHFPQSFEHSTVGGWIATRSGGHFATNYTHIDDFVESLSVLTPSGKIVTRRLPGSGAGPSPDRIFIGSEGILGVITEAWMRVQDRPIFKSSAAVRFHSFESAVEAARVLSQTGLFPSNCRLLDSGEAATSANVHDGSCLLLVGFESAHLSVETQMHQAIECCLDMAGEVPEGIRTSSGQGVAGNWRSSFIQAPYLRDAIASMGWIAETFETSVTWDKFGYLHGQVTAAVNDALAKVCGGGSVTCRFTHVYPDGPAPYYTVIAPASHDSQLIKWKQIKAAASDAIIASGGTITHHHSVGRVHRPWYDKQRPGLFAVALRAVKQAVDPAAILNPGVLIDNEGGDNALEG